MPQAVAVSLVDAIPISPWDWLPTKIKIPKILENIGKEDATNQHNERPPRDTELPERAVNLSANYESAAAKISEERWLDEESSALAAQAPKKVALPRQALCLSAVQSPPEQDVFANMQLPPSPPPAGPPNLPPAVADCPHPCSPPDLPASLPAAMLSPMHSSMVLPPFLPPSAPPSLPAAVFAEQDFVPFSASFAPAPAADAPVMMSSTGSQLHGTGLCRPCAWYWKKAGCQNGNECGHCHQCPQSEIKERRKAKQVAARCGLVTPKQQMHNGLDKQLSGVLRFFPDADKDNAISSQTTGSGSSEQEFPQGSGSEGERSAPPVEVADFEQALMRLGLSTPKSSPPVVTADRERAKIELSLASLI